MWSDSIRTCSLCWIPPKHQRVGEDTRQPQKGIGYGTSATVVSWQTAFFTIWSPIFQRQIIFSDTIRSQSWLGQDMLACSTGPITKYIQVWWLFEARICTKSGNTAPQITSYLCKLRGISPLPKLHESTKTGLTYQIYAHFWYWSDERCLWCKVQSTMWSVMVAIRYDPRSHEK